jgi:septal ring factor EnvC (AmiA/AmiB activator)
MVDPTQDPQLWSAKAQIEAVRQERDTLARQIRQSEETIARSRALIERLDAILAKIQPEE